MPAPMPPQGPASEQPEQAAPQGPSAEEVLSNVMQALSMGQQLVSQIGDPQAAKAMDAIVAQFQALVDHLSGGQKPSPGGPMAANAGPESQPY